MSPLRIISMSDMVGAFLGTTVIAVECFVGWFIDCVIGVLSILSCFSRSASIFEREL